MSFATKLCHIVYEDGRARDIMKQPQTDASKFSLPGGLQNCWVRWHSCLWCSTALYAQHMQVWLMSCHGSMLTCSDACV